jgi:hypothetical protein
MNACALLIEAASVMSSCTGTTVEEAWMSDANLARASSAAANLREPCKTRQSRADAL